MVHVFCTCKDCRKVMHLNSQSYWNFEGKVMCPHCGSDVEVVIRNGEVVLSSKKHPPR